MKKSSDRIMHSAHACMWINGFFICYMLIGVLRIWHLMHLRIDNFNRNTHQRLSQQNFINAIIRRRRKLSKRSKLKRSKSRGTKSKLTRIMELATMHATSKQPSVFLNKEDFYIGATYDVIHNYATDATLSTNTLFVVPM